MTIARAACWNLDQSVPTITRADTSARSAPSGRAKGSPGATVCGYARASLMKLEANFIEDVRGEYSARLRDLGYDLPSLTGDAYQDAQKVCVDHWNAVTRRIPVRPRAIHRSNELRAHAPGLSPNCSRRSRRSSRKPEAVWTSRRD